MSNNELNKYVNIIKSGSDGNCIIYNDIIMVDVGVSYNSIKEYLNSVAYIFLTHIHSDHYNQLTVEKIIKNNPLIMFIVPDYMESEVNFIKGLKGQVFIINQGKQYLFDPAKRVNHYLNKFIVNSFELKHDVKNVGYLFKFVDKKIFHATDTGTLKCVDLQGVKPDIFAVEANYDDSNTETYNSKDYLYKQKAYENHLSERQAMNFFQENKNKTSILIQLHKSKNY